MESKIAQAIGLANHPVVVALSDRKPEGALQFAKGKFGCVMFMFANVVKGRTAVFDAETWGCWGGGVGLGFGNTYRKFPGGVEGFCCFLSSGNCRTEKGRQVAAGMAGRVGEEMLDDFLEGERYKEGPAEVEAWINDLPMTEIAARYVVFTPLDGLNSGVDEPKTVVFTVDADQLAALVVLANYGRPGMDNVIIPWVAGCQAVGILPLREGMSPTPRAVVGMMDISARRNVRKLLGGNCVTVALPWKLYEAMEGEVESSFLRRNTWRALMEMRKA